VLGKVVNALNDGSVRDHHHHCHQPACSPPEFESHRRHNVAIGGYCAHRAGSRTATASSRGCCRTRSAAAAMA
jgi:hypothetical protein